MSVEHPCTIAAFDVGGTKMAGALVRYSAADAAPTVDALRSVPTEAQRGGSAVLDTLASLVADVVADAEDDVVGIGVGRPGSWTCARAASRSQRAHARLDRLSPVSRAL